MAFKHVPNKIPKVLAPKGQINVDLFLKWLQHFNEYVRPSNDNHVLLLLDNHSSHISLPAITFCRNNGIHLLSIPPHSSHKLQALDVGFFGPLKNSYAQEAYSFGPLKNFQRQPSIPNILQPHQQLLQKL
ncbi:hypothetical protein NQ318_018499 [Aromia moschata]|uniref:DDE-1 domain-containing protein n=1 Tax=Aromia moschata TaxID=1265417 RepID=A0AAV8X3F0_9CUCU|nr:hypothetical protein NQ318_018499 [Aromia moschata]